MPVFYSATSLFALLFWIVKKKKKKKKHPKGALPVVSPVKGLIINSESDSKHGYIGKLTSMPCFIKLHVQKNVKKCLIF